MGIDRILESMKEGMHPLVSLEPKGGDRYLIHTGYTFPDGDELHMILERKCDGWTITDDAHTMMWLSFEDFDESAEHMAALYSIIQSNGASFEEGRISVDRIEENAGERLRTMTQTLLQAARLLNLYSPAATES